MAANNENFVSLTGNLVEAPELRFTPSGVAMANLRIAVNKRWRDQDGEWQSEGHFFSGTAWRDLAEHAADSLNKGDRITITGRLQQRTWETDEGDKRSMVDIDIDDISTSLRFATVSVTRMTREGGGGGGNRGPAPQARDDYGPDDAPF